MKPVLSIFPGIDLMGRAFREVGFCVVRGGDWIFGEDIRDEHYPSGCFSGVIGGPPCQRFSSAANISRARGQRQQLNLIPEFERVVSECEPDWWVMENVVKAPIPKISGYKTYHQVINARWFGSEQRRIRRISSNLRLLYEPSLTRPYKQVPTASTAMWINGRQCGCKTRKHFDMFKVYQGLDESFDLPAFRVDAAVKAVVNGVPMAMGRAIAKAVMEQVQAAEQTP